MRFKNIGSKLKNTPKYEDQNIFLSLFLIKKERLIHVLL